jgi:20S proteasome alpha/beta subunit
MGKDLYHQYSMELAKFDLGLELLVYGFTRSGVPAIFEVANPGKIISHDRRGYAAVGSGSLMALAALNKKPLGPTLSDTIYRLYDAKFSAETARDVGKKTHVITLGKDGKNGFSVDDEVSEIHKIWTADLARPHPAEAIKLINHSGLVIAISKKE